MKNKIQLIVLLFLAVLCLFFLYRHFFPNEEKRVRRRIDALAEAVSIPENPTTTATIAAGDRLRGFLTSDIEVEVDMPDGGRRTFSGRPDIIRAAMAAHASAQGFRVRFFDVNITLGPDAESAIAELTAQVVQKGEEDFTVQELKFTWRKEDNEWRLAKAETVRTLKL